LQSTLRLAVTEAIKLFVHDPFKFVILVPTQSGNISQDRSRLFAQFSSTAPKVINYDPDKPVKRRRESSVDLAVASHMQMSYSRRMSTASTDAALPQKLDVISLLYCTVFLC